MLDKNNDWEPIKRKQCRLFGCHCHAVDIYRYIHHEMVRKREREKNCAHRRVDMHRNYGDRISFKLYTFHCNSARLYIHTSICSTCIHTQAYIIAIYTTLPYVYKQFLRGSKLLATCRLLLFWCVASTTNIVVGRRRRRRRRSIWYWRVCVCIRPMEKNLTHLLSLLYEYGISAEWKEKIC